MTTFSKRFAAVCLGAAMLSVAAGCGESSPGAGTGSGALGDFAASCAHPAGMCFNYYGRPLTAEEQALFADERCGDYTAPCPTQNAVGSCTGITAGVPAGLTAMYVLYTGGGPEAEANCAGAGGVWRDSYAL